VDPATGQRDANRSYEPKWIAISTAFSTAKLVSLRLPDAGRFCSKDGGRPRSLRRRSAARSTSGDGHADPRPLIPLEEDPVRGRDHRSHARADGKPVRSMPDFVYHPRKRPVSRGCPASVEPELATCHGDVGGRLGMVFADVHDSAGDRICA
jgi:hypothetical protein